MIVRILSQGKSFKGLAAYLTHDPDAKSAERVGWAHTLNLANDHVPSAVDEMLWTARNAELLKQEAGIRAGGRASENTVKHVSLNWSPEEAPTRAHMIETAEGFLQHMNWQEHQTLIVAHEDKAHAHVHLMVNTIHPETGLRLDDNFERRRAQTWARGYEEENGRVFCPQRLKNAEEREDAPTRPAWMAFQNKQKEFEREEKARENQAPIFLDEPENPQNSKSTEWKKLKEMQREERLTFFSEGKLEFSDLRRSVYREVREEFREKWADFYEAQKNGGDDAAVAARKKELVTEQKELLDQRRDDACTELKDSRNIRYRALLDDQRDIRHQMRARQESGFDNAIFLRLVGERDTGADRPVPSFRDVAGDTAGRPVAERDNQPWPFAAPRHDRVGNTTGADVGARVATGLGFGILSILGGLVDAVAGPTPAAWARPPDSEARSDLFDDAAKEASRRQQAEDEDAESEKRKRQRSYDGD
jgi:hypothetical protein